MTNDVKMGDKFYWSETNLRLERDNVVVLMRASEDLIQLKPMVASDSSNDSDAEDSSRW